MTPPRPSAPSSAPATSNRRRPAPVREASSSRLSGTQRSAASTTGTASGRLMKKIHRQERASISQPPTSGPSAVETPASPDHAPIARPRSSGWKLGLDDRQRAGGEQRTPDALEEPGRDQPAGALGQAAQRRGDGEPDHPDQEHPPPPEPVAERAAEQHERGQHEQVPVDGPLETGHRGAQFHAEAGQGHVDHGAVQEDHAGGEDRGEQRPPGGGGRPSGARA